MKKLFENKPRLIFWVGFYFVILLMLVGVIVGLRNSGEVLAVVGGEKITKLDLEDSLYGINFIENTEYTDKERDSELNQLIESAIIRQEAAKAGLVVTEEEIAQHISDTIGDDRYQSYTEKQKILTKKAAEDYLLGVKLKESLVGWREAEYLVFNFHKYFETDNKDYQADGMGDKGLIDKNKRDALTLAEDYKSRLSSGEWSFDQAARFLENDKNFGTEAMMPRTPVLHGSVSRNMFINDMIKASQKNDLLSLSDGDVGGPFVDSGNFNEFGSGVKEYRYIVYVVTGAGGSISESYQEWLEKKFEEYGITNKSSLSLLFPKANAAAASCNSVCSSDNAELYVYARYLNANSSWRNLSDANIVEAWAGNQASNYPWALNDGSNCASPAPLQKIYGKTRPDADSYSGEWSSCDTGDSGQTNSPKYSYYCAVQSILYVKYKTPSISGSIPSEGRWDWRTRTAANNYSDFASGKQHAEYTKGELLTYLNLRVGRNVENQQMNGQLLYQEVDWYPYWNNIPTPSRVSVTSETNFVANSLRGGDTDGGLAPVVFTGRATDPDPGDGVGINIMYKKSDEGNWRNFGANSFGAGTSGDVPDGGYSVPVIYGGCGPGNTNFSHNKVCHTSTTTTRPLNINANGWKIMNNHDSLSNFNWQSSGTNISYPTVYLKPGTYSWAVRALDKQSGYSGWTTTGSFTVRAAPVTTLIAPTSNAIIDQGSNNVRFSASVTADPSPDVLGFGVFVQYREVGSTAWQNFSASALSCSSGGTLNSINVNGWRPDVSGYCFVGKGETVYYPRITLPAGSYEWQARGLFGNQGTRAQFAYGPYTPLRYFTVTGGDCSIADFVATPTSGEAPLGVGFTFAHSNATSTVLDFDDGTSFLNPSSPRSHTYNNVGTYTARLTCQPGNISATQTITVTSPNNPPTIQWTSQTPADGANIQIPEGSSTINQIIESRATDPDGDRVKITVGYRECTNLLCDDMTVARRGEYVDPSWQTGTAALANINATNLTTGKYLVYTYAVDERGGTSPVISRYFNVLAAPSLSCTVSPASGTAPLSVTITPTSNYTNPTYEYDIEYNGTSFTPEYTGRTGPAYHTYNTPGLYTVRIWVTGTTHYANCTSDVNVQSPQDGDGGEVAP